MTLRSLLIPALCAAGLTACDLRITSTTRNENADAKGALTVVQTLQCPQTMGSLTRKGSASDGGSVCTYAGPRGSEVSLHLVKLDGAQPAEALKAFEDRLSAAMPQAVAQLRAAAEKDSVAAPAAAPASGDRATVRAPGVDIRAEGDDATVRLPGLRIESKGDQASVRIGGFHIDATEDGSTANIATSGEGEGDNVSVQANQDAAEIRTSAGGGATRASWILTDNRPSEAGWRLVGYEARGPAGGPIVVATVRARDRDRGRVFEDAKDLVTLNVGE